MGLKGLFQKIEKKYAWGFLGFALAILTTAWSVYVTYFRDLNPNLEIIVETNTKVLDLKENVRKLDVLYKGENIKESHKNLSIIKIKIQNPTSTNITINSYDPKEPIGFKLDKGEIVEKTEIIDASNDYLKNNLLINIDTSNSIITCNPIIIEGDDFFIIKFLVLHKQNETPEIISLGKIAGIKKIEVINRYKTAEKKTIWLEALSGNFLIQSIRAVIYTIGFSIAIFILALIILLPIIGIIDFFKERKRKKHIRNFKLKKDLEDTAETNLIFDNYISNGLDYLISIQELLLERGSLEKNLNYLITKEKNEKAYFSTENIHQRIKLVTNSPYEGDNLNNYSPLIDLLYNNKIVNINEKNTLVINETYTKTLDAFISYINLI